MGIKPPQLIESSNGYHGSPHYHFNIYCISGFASNLLRQEYGDADPADSGFQYLADGALLMAGSTLTITDNFATYTPILPRGNTHE